jgi:hypothetical protein
LATAVGFAVWLNTLLLGTFLWPEWMPVWLRTGGWILLGIFWGSAAWAAWQVRDPGRVNAAGESLEDLLTNAQTEYLKGHWFEAESLLQRLAARPGGDVMASLMLAKVCRRQARSEEGLEHLDRVERSEGSERWHIELVKERELLQQLYGAPAGGDVEPDEGLEEVAEMRDDLTPVGTDHATPPAAPSLARRAA